MTGDRTQRALQRLQPGPAGLALGQNPGHPALLSARADLAAGLVPSDRLPRSLKR
jgi:DNA-directed RNA polymerase subunit K/omega